MREAKLESEVLVSTKTKYEGLGPTCLQNARLLLSKESGSILGQLRVCPHIFLQDACVAGFHIADMLEKKEDSVKMMQKVVGFASLIASNLPLGF